MCGEVSGDPGHPPGSGNQAKPDLFNGLDPNSNILKPKTDASKPLFNTKTPAHSLIDKH